MNSHAMPYVLIVDDSPTDVITFRRHLTKGVAAPCEVESVATAAEALAKMNQRRPQCLLLDFHLPDSDGVQLVRQLVRQYGINAFGIVMLTSNNDVELAVEALRSGAHDFLPKNSTDSIVLRRAVDNAMEKAAIQRELNEQRAALAEKNRELEVHIARLEEAMSERLHIETLLRETALQMRLVTDHAAVLLGQCDREFRYKFVNKPYAERFGLEIDQIIGRSASEIVGPEVFAKVKPYLEATMKGERTEFEIHIPYHGNGDRWMQVVYVPERAEDGTVVGLVGVMTDTTARKKAELALSQARDEALEASRAKDDFLAALSHELRTPLNPILLLSSDAATDPSLPAETREVFEIIRKNVDLEARLIDDLLDITQISRGKMRLDKEALNIQSVLEDALTIVKAEAQNKNLNLKSEFKACHTTVWGDAVRLQQVFWNVLKNAVKFTPGGGTVSISLENAEGPCGQSVKVTVTDTGLGMTDKELGRVFDAFAQGDHATAGGSHRFGGLGLGLAISHRLVENHDGQIEATSRGRGHGSTFIIHLPTGEEAQDSGAASSLRESSESAIVPSMVKILLVEDHEPTRAGLSLLLKRRNYQVEAVSTMKEALLVIETEVFDLLISDIGLPDGTGYDLMEALREKSSIPAIALTGYGMEKDVQRGNAAGFAAHLTKPIEIQALEKVIVSVLKKGALE